MNMIDSFKAKINRGWRWRLASVRGFIFDFYKLLMRCQHVQLTTSSSGIIIRNS
jgi:hypothetical protein